MTTKVYDAVFNVPISKEQFAEIRTRYEVLRKTELYRGRRIRKTFQTKDAIEGLRRETENSALLGHNLGLTLSISFPRAAEEGGEARWREYCTTLIRMFGAFPLNLKIRPDSTEKTLSYDVSSVISENGASAEQVLRLLLIPESTRYALEPITISLTGRRNTASGENETAFQSRFELNKSPCQDFVILSDIPLVFSYYKQIGEILLNEIAHRGLTTYCAVDTGDGESVIRRNGVGGQRLVVDEIEEIGRLIMDFDVFRFVPDVNHYDSSCISRIPIDFDRPPSMDWKNFSEFVNGFLAWLKDQGFNPRLRLTGGRGAQIILDISMDRIAKNYCTPFPRPLKFDTWIRRVGPAGLISAQATDLVKSLALAYGSYRKHKMGLSAPLTVEIHDLTQRYWNILVDSSRAAIDTGVVGLGSIHHKTGAVCMPVASVPSSFTLESAISASYYPDVEPVEFRPKYKSPWIQMIGSNPILLCEPSLSSHNNPLSLVEEVFEKYSWIPNEYVRMTSERFMEKYCWA